MPVLLIITGAAAPSQAAPLFNFYTDASQTAVGDVVKVTFRTNMLVVLPGAFEYTYRIPEGARYIPNSFEQNGAPIPDSDPRLSVSKTEVHLTLPFAPIGANLFELRLRVTGEIGQAIHHLGILGGIYPEQKFRAYPTRIEDETATILTPDADADATLSEANPTWNFGVSGTLLTARNPGQDAHAVLKYDLSSLAGVLPAGWEVQAAYLELYPLNVAGEGALEVKPLELDWNEGLMDAAPCFNGATWTTSNCVKSWDGGGKTGGKFDAINLTQAMTYAQLDLTEYVVDVMHNKKPDYGVALDFGSDGTSLELASREATANSVLSPRLVIVAAPAGSYNEPAASQVNAEIIPTKVIAGVGNTRFEYWMQPRIEFGETGVNRLSISVPADFQLKTVDSLRIGGAPYQLGDGSTLNPFEYENWGSSSRIDLRFFPAITWIDGNPPIEIVLHAVPPVVPTAARHFPSTADHDRRGQPAMNAKEGNVNFADGPGDDNSWKVETLSTPLARIEVAPADTAVAVGYPVAYRALAVFADSSRIDVTQSASWDVTPMQLGSFDSLGVLATEQTGSGFVSATWNAVSSNLATLQVDPAELVSLFVSPDNQTIPVGGSAVFQATGVYSTGDSLDLTSSASWTVDDSTVADFSGPGVLDALSPGDTHLQAESSGLLASAFLSVTPAELTQIDISPADTSVALGFDVQLIATGTYSDGTSSDITSVVAWNTNPSGIVDIGVNGTATTLNEGVTSITASLTDVASSPASFTVTPPVVVSLNGTPDTASVTVSGFHAVQSFATYSNGDITNKTSSVTWQSLDPSIANFVTPGTVAALSPGTARLTHSLGAIVGDTLLVTVTLATVDSIVVSPATLTLPPGSGYQLSATGYWSDGSDQDVTSQSNWFSNNVGIASVDANGIVSANAEGSALITALFSGKTSSCSLTVSIAAFDSLVIQPSSTSTPVGISKAHAALAYQDGQPLDVTSSVLWSTADTLVAVVDSTGSVTGRSIGSTTLHASIGALLATPTPVQVTEAIVTDVHVQPASTTLRLGTSKQLAALATYSDGQVLDVTSSALWTSMQPSTVYMQPGGLALGLSLGSAGITATWDVESNAAILQVLPSVQVEALPIGNTQANPGAQDVLLLSLRLSNHDVQTHELSAVRINVNGPADSLRLWLDNGDGIFDADSDFPANRGIPGNGRWTATNVSATVPVAGSKTIFLSTDVSSTNASHGDRLDAFLASDADLFWETPTAVVSQAGFPLDSFGEVTCQHLVLSQLSFEPQPADTVYPGATEVPLMRFVLPKDGGAGDTMNSITVQQIGSATADLDLAALRLQTTQVNAPQTFPTAQKTGTEPDTDTATWQNVATLVHTGANQWVASGLSIDVPTNATKQARVVATLATSAREGRTVQVNMPASAMTFASGRIGPLDSSWTNPNATLIEAQHQLIITQTIVVPPVNPISRQADPQIVLGLELTAWSATDDELSQLTLNHISTGPGGPASNVDAQILSAHLWQDVDDDGGFSPADIELASSIPGNLVAGQIEFGTASPLNVPLPSAQPVNLLVSLQLDPDLVRDAEALRVQLASAQQVQTQGALEVVLPAPLQTLAPPVVDGQELSGYDVRSLEGTVLLPKTNDILVMDFRIPANGVDDDVLEAIRLENSGDATGSDITGVRLIRDDGNNVFDDGDPLVAMLVSAGTRAWEAAGLSLPLQQADPRRFWVTIDVANNAVSGRTFRATIPLDGIEVTSGNDGPIDAPLIAGGAHLISVQNRVTWLAGPGSTASVAPNAIDRAILGLQAFNGYSNTRRLTSLDVAVRGTADPQEFQLWRLHSDENGNGSVDGADIPLAIASIANGRLLFSGFQWDMQPQLQRNLLVSYSLNPQSARDASQIDAVIESENAFDYQQGGTRSIGAFELDSPGIHTVDGMILSQIGNLSVAQRSLGGGETDVLTLDLLLPSNGWQEDTLRALQVQLSSTPPAATYGTDILEVKLWQESDASPLGAQFDPASDIFLQRAVQSGGTLLFANIDTPIAVGGQRFYATVDMAASPTDGTRVQLIVPTNGIVMQSGNDGPLNQQIQETAVHTVSSSDLLASIDVQPLLASVGQQVSVSVGIRNQGSVQLDSIFVDQLTVEPPGAAALVSGPNPAFVSLAPQSEDTIDYVFSMSVAGEVRFTVRAAELSGPRYSDVAESPTIVVEQPPSGLSLAPLSNLPPSVNRGQISVTPLVWRLTHPDTDPSAADISIDTVQLMVQDAGGASQIASDVFDSLEIRTGGLVHAVWDSIPADSVLTVSLDVPVLLTAGEQRDLPLTVSIAADASASAFQVHLEGSGAIGAVDANSGQPVTLVANLPWSTQSANVLTPATTIEVLTNDTLPVGINEGQMNVPAGSLTFILPGAPGESEARITELTLSFEDSGQVLLAEDLFSRVRVRDGTTTLLDLQDIQSVSQTLPLTLSIPKVVVAGDSVRLDVSFDLLNAIDTTHLEVVVADSTAITVRDANSGAVVSVSRSGGTPFPWKQGPTTVQVAAQLLDVATVTTAPTGTFPGATQMPIVELILANLDAPGSANMHMETLAFEILDDIGNPQVASSVITAARCFTDGVLTAETTGPTGLQVLLSPTTPLVLAPGDSARVTLQVDLSPNLGEPWIRFHLPSNAISVRDANDPVQTISVLGMPASTALIQVVAEASSVGLGALADPPINVVPGSVASPLLPIRIEHPGASNEADIQPQTLVVRLRDAQSQPLATAAIATTSQVVWDSLSMTATADADSLLFDLSGLPSIAAGEFLDLQLQMDLATTVAVSDFRLALPGDALRATSGGGQALTVQPAGYLGLPYESPTIHITANNLEESFTSYPNPFIPAQGPCNITFFLPGDSRVTCDVYTLSGDRVSRLLNGVPLAAGLHDDLSWNGRNERGDVVRNGTYLLRIQVDGAGGGEFYRKLAVIR